jgi:hypothetical protein
MNTPLPNHTKEIIELSQQILNNIHGPINTKYSVHNLRYSPANYDQLRIVMNRLIHNLEVLQKTMTQQKELAFRGFGASGSYKKMLQCLHYQKHILGPFLRGEKAINEKDIRNIAKNMNHVARFSIQYFNHIMKANANHPQLTEVMRQTQRIAVESLKNRQSITITADQLRHFRQMGIRLNPNSAHFIPRLTHALGQMGRSSIRICSHILRSQPKHYWASASMAGAGILSRIGPMIAATMMNPVVMWGILALSAVAVGYMIYMGYTNQSMGKHLFGNASSDDPVQTLFSAHTGFSHISSHGAYHISIPNQGSIKQYMIYLPKRPHHYHSTALTPLS